ncbi:MAG: glycosyltransferase family 2 protein [Candidatus Bathyarchaeia archaeon]
MRAAVESGNGGSKHFIVVGIPAFNEEKTIAKVVLKAQKHADKVVVCDDGSTDLTADIARRMDAEVIRHDRNLGYGASIRSLFTRAKELDADVLVTLDADGQHDPDEIPTVVKPIIEGAADVVIGSRFTDNGSTSDMRWYRQAGIKLITRLTNNASKYHVKDAQSGFRAYGRRSLENLDVSENGMGASVELLLDANKHGLKIQEVPTTCNYSRGNETSTQNPVRHGFSVVTSIFRLLVEDKPLILLGLPGLVFTIVGVLFGIWLLQSYAVAHRIITNIALASIGFVFIGFFCMSTAITLYAISRLAERVRRNHE